MRCAVEVERLYAEARQRQLRDTDITRYIDDHVEMGRVLRSTMPLFDGGYVMCGITGSGEMFAVRDPWGIRPAFWYQDDEVVVVASERPVIQTCFNLDADRIVELLPGQSLTVKRCGEVSTEQIVPPQETRKCSFERIYFSRGSDWADCSRLPSAEPSAATWRTRCSHTFPTRQRWLSMA